MRPRLMLGLLLIALVVLFVFQNTEVVSVQFLFWGVSMSGALLIFLVLAVGVLAGWLLRSGVRRRRTGR